MAMYALLRNKPQPTTNDIDESIQGNLCRCTGYRPILESYYSFAVDGNGIVKANDDDVCPMGESCCKKMKIDPSLTEDKRREVHQLTDLSTCPKYDPTQEPIFPPELQVN